LYDVGAFEVGVFERNELEVATPDTLPFSESPLPLRLLRSPSIEPGALNRWMCGSSSEERRESRGVGGKGMLPPLLLAGEVDLNALKLCDVDEESVLLEKTGDEPTPEPVPDDPDCDEPEKRAAALCPCTATALRTPDSGILTLSEGVAFAPADLDTLPILGLPPKANDDGGGGCRSSIFLRSASTLTLSFGSLFPSKSGDKGNE
jgi:hypothetical protein